jgi:F-type H+-transporting ATPase subunit gamma
VRAVRKVLREKLAQHKQVRLYCIGRKGAEQLQSEFGALIVARKTEVGKRKLAYTEAEALARDLIARFELGEFDTATIVYNRFKSAIAQVVTFQQLIPLADSGSRIADSEPTANHQPLSAPYTYEPSEDDILADLLPRNIGVQIYKALLENAASEQGARMTAMDNATRNAGDMIKRLNLQYNRSRQAAITKELIEIISGAEAV